MFVKDFEDEKPVFFLFCLFFFELNMLMIIKVGFVSFFVLHAALKRFAMNSVCCQIFSN